MSSSSRKRHRSPPVDILPVAKYDDHERGSLLDTWLRLEEHSSLQSLVMREADDPSHLNSAVKAVPARRFRVQQVWGALNEADVVSSGASGLRFGTNAEVDRNGVAWLLNSSTTSRPTSPETSTRVHCGLEANDAPPLTLCDADLMAQLSRLKEAFNDIPVPVFKRVRSECNPAEALGSGPFLNRSAMKLANIDAIARLSDLEPLSHDPAQVVGAAAQLASTPDDGVSQKHSPASQREQLDKDVQREDLLTEARQGQSTPRMPLLFADLCGGPGGFSEYLLRKRGKLGLPAQGWGISLRENSHNSSSFDSGSGRVLGGVRDQGKTSNKVVPRGEGGMSPYCGNQDVARVDRTLDDAAAGTLWELPEGTKDPCAWRLDRLALWCNVTIKPRKGRSSIEATDADCAAPRRAPEQAPADVGKAYGEDGHGVVNIVNIRDKEPETEAVCPVERRGDRRSCCRPLGREAGGDSSKVTLSRSPSPANIRNDAIGSDAEGCEGQLLKMTIDYGPKGTGDLLDAANMVGFVDSVLASTGGRRLDVVVADGGLAAARDASDQERLILPLLCAEALAALHLLAERGSFVCKMFEAWTVPTASLVYLLYRMFRRVSIVKPVTSRPASGERYLVCAGLLPQPPNGFRLVEHLEALAALAWERAPSSVASSSGGGCNGGLGVLDLESEMKNDTAFISFLRLVNDRLATVQGDACSRIIEASSTKWGRAWAFRGGKGRGNACSTDDSSGVAGGELAEDEAWDDSFARRCFMQAWEVNALY